MNKLGGKVRELRLIAGITQTDLARSLGTSQTVIQRLEQGKYPANFEVMKKFFTKLAGYFSEERTKFIALWLQDFEEEIREKKEEGKLKWENR